MQLNPWLTINFSPNANATRASTEAHYNKIHKLILLTVRVRESASDSIVIEVDDKLKRHGNILSRADATFDSAGEVNHSIVIEGRNHHPIFIAVIYKTHFGMTDIFVFDRRSRSIKHKLTCLSAVLTELPTGVIEERATGKYVNSSNLSPFSRSATLSRKWKWNNAGQTFRAGRWRQIKPAPGQ